MAAPFIKRHEVKFIAVCMGLLTLAAGWFLSTRPGHQVEGDFLEREQAAQVDEWLVAQLENTIAEHRARACLAIGRIGGPEAVSRLAPLVEDHAPSVRAAAAFALGIVEDQAFRGSRDVNPEAAQALLGLLEDDERRVAMNAVDSLGRMAWAAAAPAIIETAAPLPVTLAALVRMGDRTQIPWMIDQLRSPDQDGRWAAALTLGELAFEPDVETTPLFTNLQRDHNNFVRAAAARALRYAKPSELTLGALESFASDLDPKIQFEAFESLVHLGIGGADEALRKLIGQADTLPPRDPTPSGAVPDIGPVLEPRELQIVARTVGRHLRLETTSGAFEIELDYENAPLTSERFYRLATTGGFDGVSFGRVRPNGYAQARANDAGAFRSELNPRPFLRGSLGLVRAKANLDAPEFFIALTPLPFADGRFTNFGRLLSGDDLLDKIAPSTRILAVKTAVD